MLNWLNLGAPPILLTLFYGTPWPTFPIGLETRALGREHYAFRHRADGLFSNQPRRSEACVVYRTINQLRLPGLTRRYQLKKPTLKRSHPLVQPAAHTPNGPAHSCFSSDNPCIGDWLNTFRHRHRNCARCICLSEASGPKNPSKAQYEARPQETFSISLSPAGGSTIRQNKSSRPRLGSTKPGTVTLPAGPSVHVRSIILLFSRRTSNTLYDEATHVLRPMANAPCCIRRESREVVGHQTH